jgi:hypothetical protein
VEIFSQDLSESGFLIANYEKQFLNPIFHTKKYHKQEKYFENIFNLLNEKRQKI